MRSRGEASDGQLAWQTVSAPEAPVPLPPSRVARFWLTVGPLSVRTGLVWNLLIALPTLYYFCLPYGSVAVNENLVFFWLLPTSAATLLVGLPLYIRAIWGRWRKQRPFGPELAALLFCLTPLFLSLSLLWLAGVARGLKSGCTYDSTKVSWAQDSGFGGVVDGYCTDSR